MAEVRTYTVEEHSQLILKLSTQVTGRTPPPPQPLGSSFGILEDGLDLVDEDCCMLQPVSISSRV